MNDCHYRTDIRDPKVKVSSLIQRGNDLVVACRRDRAELEACGLKWEEVEELAALVRECSDAEAQWIVGRKSVAMEREELDAYAGECRRFRNGIVSHLREAHGGSKSGVSLPRFKKNGSRAEIVQDLHDLYVLCRKYAERKYANVTVDPHLGPKAYEMSQKLSSMYTSEVLQRDRSEELKDRRNTLCNRMYSIVQNVCACGRQTFRKDPRRKDYYCYKTHNNR